VAGILGRSFEVFESFLNAKSLFVLLRISKTLSFLRKVKFFVSRPIYYYLHFSGNRHIGETEVKKRGVFCAGIESKDCITLEWIYYSS